MAQVCSKKIAGGCPEGFYIVSIGGNFRGGPGGGSQQDIG